MAVWNPSEQDQGSILTDPFLYEPMLQRTSTMATGLYGGRHFVSGTRQWMAGYSSDLSVARAMTGQSMFGRAYSKYLAGGGAGSSWLSQNVPMLNQLSVGRHLTFMSGVGGEVGSINTMTGLQNIEKMTDAVMRTKGLSYQESMNFLFNKSGGTQYGTVARSWEPFSRAPFINDAARADASWQRTMYRSYGHQAPFNWGEAMQMRGVENSAAALADANAEFGARMASINADIMAGRNTAADKAMRRQLVRDLAAETGTTRSAMGRGAAALAERAAASESIYAMIGLRSIPKIANVGSKAIMQYGAFQISSLGGMAAAWGVKKMATLPGDLYRKITSDIHRGSFISSAPLSPFVGATGRQRAIADIHYKQLNLSQALGNESKYLLARGY